MNYKQWNIKIFNIIIIKMKSIFLELILTILDINRELQMDNRVMVYIKFVWY